MLTYAAYVRTISQSHYHTDKIVTLSQNQDLGEIEVGLGLAAVDVKNAATACNSNGTAFTECTDDVEKISAQLAKVTTHATSAGTDCSPAAGTECAFNLGNLVSE